MKLFKKRHVEEEVDPRTELEKTFEEKGQTIGRKTGKVVQKGVNKFHQVKTKLEEDGTIDKFRRLSDKVDDKIDAVVDKVAKKTKRIGTKHKHKNEELTPKDDTLFYE